jgi:hypothetical protein
MDSGVVLLKAAEASITTCTVTIKALKINNRQMTQSIFRQLPSEPLFDETTLEVAGTTTVWGWVNYAPKDECGKQFVVQKGDRLVRCPVRMRQLGRRVESWPRPLQSSYAWTELDGAAYVLAAALEGALVYHEELVNNIRRQCYQVDMNFPFSGRNYIPGAARNGVLGYDDGAAIGNAINPKPFLGWAPGGGSQVTSTADEVREIGRQALRKAIVAVAEVAEGCPGDEQEIVKSAFWRRRLDDRAAKALDYVRRWNALMVKLEAADQLYIAT